MISEFYRSQADLLLQVIPHIAEEKVFAMKGGTAINLFLRSMPRLSVDIDLTYLGFDIRETALSNISDALGRIRGRIQKTISDTTFNNQITGGNEVKLLVRSKKAQIKIEVNYITRGHLFPVQFLQVGDLVQEEFRKFAAIQVISTAELYGGKICAALDRQHPRDFFDIFLLFQESGITEEIKYGFIAALVSHMRPIHELLNPNFLDQRIAFENQFTGMSSIPFTYEDFKKSRERLVREINSNLSEKDRSFLITFKLGYPEWDLFPEPRLKEMPAV